MVKTRYQVSVCFATYRAPMAHMPISVDQDFTNRRDAERFAEWVSHYLPRRNPLVEDGMPLAWVLVSALATSDAVRVSTGPQWCYLSFDPGGVVVKRHDIGRGYYGARCTTCHSDISEVTREAA